MNRKPTLRLVTVISTKIYDESGRCYGHVSSCPELSDVTVTAVERSDAGDFLEFARDTRSGAICRIPDWYFCRVASVVVEDDYYALSVNLNDCSVGANDNH